MLAIKRGDTFAFYVNLMDMGNSPLVMDEGGIRSQIRNGLEDLVEELSIEPTDTIGKYKLFAQSTADWPITDKDIENNLFMDIEVTIDGITRSSRTVRIKVEKDVTRDV